MKIYLVLKTVNGLDKYNQPIKYVPTFTDEIVVGVYLNSKKAEAKVLEDENRLVAILEAEE